MILQKYFCITHIESGRTYEVRGDIKVKIDGKWIDCVMYEPDDSPGELYARPRNDFEGKFREEEH